MLYGVLIVISLGKKTYFLFMQSTAIECAALEFTEWLVYGSCRDASGLIHLQSM